MTWPARTSPPPPGPADAARASRYCECFASGKYCSACNCHNCFNNHENEETRQKAVEAILDRNPNAFRPKIQVPRAWRGGGGGVWPSCDRVKSKYHVGVRGQHWHAHPPAAPDHPFCFPPNRPQAWHLCG